jgi:hypothetical protein
MNDLSRQAVGPWTLYERLGHGGNKGPPRHGARRRQRGRPVVDARHHQRRARARDIAAIVRSAPGAALCSVGALLDNSRPDFDASLPRLLAPCDLQAIKAAGVTFVEHARARHRGAGARRREQGRRIRARIAGILGGSLTSLKPGSADARA